MAGERDGVGLAAMALSVAVVIAVVLLAMYGPRDVRATRVDRPIAGWSTPPSDSAASPDVPLTLAGILADIRGPASHPAPPPDGSVSSATPSVRRVVLLDLPRYIGRPSGVVLTTLRPEGYVTIDEHLAVAARLIDDESDVPAWPGEQVSIERGGPDAN